MDKKWRQLRRLTGYAGFFNLHIYHLQHRLFNGGWSKPLVREVLERGHAVAVLPYDQKLDSVLLIEQFRPGALRRVGGPWQIECIAGMVEQGESDVQVARREAVEEAGIELGKIHALTTFYPSPAGNSETIGLYWAMADLSAAGGVFGLEQEGEDIRASVHRLDAALAMIDDGIIDNASAIILLLMFARLRGRHG